ncbi:aminotransferase [Pleomassaria siparia CBS 279.74]|uniref:Aminotransferase n=1 Tax=Pleomassaria siparia CBS 279.74 TaxID=1314801 RepID=A0A6G1KTF9_9PLEO|nr:aminotransferase [Pleomassaria siparia CBS 279.74]
MPDPSRGSAVLHRNINSNPPTAIGANGNWISSSAGYSVFDGSGGAGVCSIGRECPKRVKNAINKALDTISYVPSLDYLNDPVEELSKYLVDSTGGKMTKVVIYTSGSEAIEASIKMARQYFVMKGEPSRKKFITRRQSYHGATLGALGLSGFPARRDIFEELLTDAGHISAYNEYRGLKPNETVAQYVQRLADELEAEILRLGPNVVAGVVIEPVVGAALGSVPAPAEYFIAMRKVVDKYGVLFILDEVMSGMGRTGTLHAWEQLGVVPDIETIGKGLAAGFQPAAGMLIGRRIGDVLAQGGGVFVHGHTYQNHPVVCAAALEVLHMIRDDKLLENVRTLTPVLEDLLRARLAGHPNVGNIRGSGFMQGIEFVKDKATKESFDLERKVSWFLHEMAMAPPYQVYIYPGGGSNDGIKGDHIQIMPPFNINEDDLHMMVDRIAKAIEAFFAHAETSLV